jgi:hypothetical protein
MDPHSIELQDPDPDPCVQILFLIVKQGHFNNFKIVRHFYLFFYLIEEHLQAR